MASLIALALVPLSTAAPETIAIPYKPATGEVATYEMRGTVPFRDGEAEFREEVTVQTISVERRGGARLRISDRKVTVTSGGENMPVPDPAPYTIEVDRRGFAKKDPDTSAFSALAVILIGVPTERITFGEEFEWKVGGFLRSPRDRYSGRWVETKDGGAGIIVHAFHAERSLSTLYKCHDLTNGRLIRGDLTADLPAGKITATLKLVSVTHGPSEG